jgi:hypothetical protein
MFIKRKELEYLQQTVSGLIKQNTEIINRIIKLEHQQFKPMDGATYKIPKGKTVTYTANKSIKK